MEATAGISVFYVILHGGVNDASSADFSEGDFAGSCTYASKALPAAFPNARILISTACVSRSQSLNKRILGVNKSLRVLSQNASFELVSNDNIMFGDLSDDVHLNGSGTARLFQNYVNALKAMFGS